MRLWRIGKTKYVGDRIGTGAKLAGGRWSSRGVAVLYFAATRSLAALEVFVHLEPGDLPVSLGAIGVDVPEELFKGRTRRTVAELPPTWRHYPAPTALQAVGDAWVRAAVSVVLELPSAVTPEESIYLLNPNHPRFRTVSWNDPEPFALDPRMWRRTERGL